MEYCKDGPEHDNIDDLIDGMLLIQEYWTVLISSVIVVDGELNMPTL